MKEMTIKPFVAGTKAGRKGLKEQVVSYFAHCSAYSAVERAAIASEVASIFDKMAAKYRKQAFEQDILPDGDLRRFTRLDDNGQPYDSSMFGKEFKYTDKNGHEYRLQVLQNQPLANDLIVKLASELYDYNESQSENPDDKVKLPTSGIDKVDECAMSLQAMDDYNFAMFQIRTYQKDIKALEAKIEELANDLRWQVGLPEKVYERKGTIKIIVG